MYILFFAIIVVTISLSLIKCAHLNKHELSITSIKTFNQTKSVNQKCSKRNSDVGNWKKSTIPSKVSSSKNNVSDKVASPKMVTTETQQCSASSSQSTNVPASNSEPIKMTLSKLSKVKSLETDKKPPSCTESLVLKQCNPPPRSGVISSSNSGSGMSESAIKQYLTEDFVAGHSTIPDFTTSSHKTE